MSKYTTELRFLCESLTGHTESVGYADARQVIQEAAPIIFDFDYPIFDNAYKLTLETKIIRHYYTREISEETYGLWKLRLEDRMKIIMPYYNELYNSTLLEFNPLWDVDLTTKHKGSRDGIVNDESYSEGNRENENTRNANSNGTLIGSKDGSNELSKNGSNSMTGGVTSNEDFIKIADTGRIGTEEENVDRTHTGSVENENGKEHVISNSGYDNSVSKQDTTGNVDSTFNTENTNIESASDKTIGNETNNATRWDLFSDTPQGGIDGLEVPNASAPSSSLEDNLYLTTARKLTDNESKNSQNSSVSDSNSIGNSNGSNTENSSETVNTENKNTRDNVEVGSANENNKTTYDERNDDDTTKTINSSESTTETNSGMKDVKNNETREYDENENNIVNENSVNVSDNNEYSKTNESETIKNNRSNVSVSTNTDEYLQNISGKSGGASYSALLMQYRETFINIDEMIIEELHDLFFGLW